MRKQLTLALSSALTIISVNAFASAAPAISNNDSFWSWNRLYVLGQAGWESEQIGSYRVNNAGSTLLFSVNENNNSGFAGRIALGYTLLPRYLDLQLGYTKYQDAVSDGNATGLLDGVGTSVDFKYRFKVFTGDLALVGKLPINDFYIYGKAGAAYTHMATSANASYAGFTDSSDISGAIKGDYSYNAWRPLLGIGFGYNASQHVFVEAGYQYLIGQSSLGNKNFIPNIQFASLGIGVRF